MASSKLIRKAAKGTSGVASKSSASSTGSKTYKGIAGMSDLVYRGKPKSHEQAKKEWIKAERDFFARQKTEGTNSLEKAIGKATPLKSSKKASKK